METNKLNFGGYNLIHLSVIVLLIVSAYFIGSLKTKVEFLENKTSAAAPQVAGATAAPQPAAPSVTLDQIKNVFKENVIKLGDANRKLLFIEIGDPSCPYCHVAAGKNGELNKQVGDRFKLVEDGGTYVAPVPEMRKLVESGKAAMAYIYTSGHGNGELGTKALYCANEKGKFWEVHDLLMNSAGYDLLNNQVKNDKAKSGELAEFLKTAFNPDDMKKCLESGKYDSRIAEDTKLASSLGVTGTPGFFVNTTNFGGAYSYTDMEVAVNEALK